MLNVRSVIPFWKNCVSSYLIWIVYEQVPSHVLMGLKQETESSTKPLSLTPFGESCLRLDLTAIHAILEKTGYKDDEGIANEVFSHT
jgi:BR-signaling kinase